MRTPGIAAVVLLAALLLGSAAGSSRDSTPWGVAFSAPPGKALLGTAVAPYGNGGLIVAGTEVTAVPSPSPNVSERVWLSEVTPEGRTAWLRVYNVSGEVMGLAVGQNGSIVVAGNFENSNSSVWVMVLNGEGDVLWAREYRIGGGYANVSSLAVESDGEIVLVGSAWVSSSLGFGVWVLKLKPDGDVEWSRIYDGLGADEGSAVAIDSKGDIIVAGTTDSFGNGYEDVWVLKLKGNGSVIWQRVYGGSNNDEARGVAVDKSGDVVVVGRTWSFGANITEGWALELAPNGNVLWAKAYGGAGYSGFNSVAVTPEGSPVIVGEVVKPSGKEYAWILKLSSNGGAIQQLIFGMGGDRASDVAVSRGTVAVVGTSLDMGSGVENAFLLVPGVRLNASCPLKSAASPSKPISAEVRSSNATVITVPPLNVASANLEVEGVVGNVSVTPLCWSRGISEANVTTPASRRAICGPVFVLLVALLPLLAGRGEAESSTDGEEP